MPVPVIVAWITDCVAAPDTSLFDAEALAPGVAEPIPCGAPAITVVFGAAVCVMLTGLCALAIGTLVRNTAAGITTMVGIYFMLPIVAGEMPQRIAELSRFLPSNASGAVWGASLSPVSMTPADGFALLCAYTVVLTAAAAWRLRRGDV